MNKTILYCLIVLNSFVFFGQKKKFFEYQVCLENIPKKDSIVLDSVNSKLNDLLIIAKDHDGNPMSHFKVTIESKNNYSSSFFTDSEGILKLHLDGECVFITIESFKIYRKQVCLDKKGLTIKMFLPVFFDSLSSSYTLKSKEKINKSKLQEIKDCLRKNGCNGECSKKYKIGISHQI